MYKMPTRIFIKFSLNELPELNDRVYRIIWGAISYCHIRDQYFADQVKDCCKLMSKKMPNDLKQFLDIVESSGLSKYGTKIPGKNSYFSVSYPSIDKLWWSRVWTLIQSGDIEVVELQKPA